MAFSTIAAIAGLASAGAGIVGSLGQKNTGQQEANRISAQQVQDAEQNAQFQRAISALINQRSVAGTSDSFGSTTHYDPATNTWVSNLGPLPQAAQRASDQAGITRNTVDLQNTELANREALRRAAAAGPMADTARRNLQDFRPMTPDTLAGLLQERATTANAQTFRPLIADTLRSFARTGTSAGPVLAQLGKANADETRKAIIDSQIAAMTGVDQINQSRRSGLESNATTTAALANPQFQFSGIQPNNAASTMAALVADRAKTASTAPATGQYGVNQATALGQAAGNNLIKNQVDPNFGLNNTLDAAGQLKNIFGKNGPLASLFGPSTNSGDTAPKPYNYNDTWNSNS